MTAHRFAPHTKNQEHQKTAKRRRHDNGISEMIPTVLTTTVFVQTALQY
jgi:hypothetical protein